VLPCEGKRKTHTIKGASSKAGASAMASPQQSAAAVATFLGRAGRLAVFAGVGGAAVQAALYTGALLSTPLDVPEATQDACMSAVCNTVWCSDGVVSLQTARACSSRLVPMRP